MVYEAALKGAKEEQNGIALAELERIAPYPAAATSPGTSTVVYKWFGKYHRPYGGIPVFWTGIMEVLEAPEYSLSDALNWPSASRFSFDALMPEIVGMDFDRATVCRVPVFLLEGRHDAFISEIAAEYFQRLSAPRKELVWFERSGHFPFVDEPSRFTEVLVRRVLALAGL